MCRLRFPFPFLVLACFAALALQLNAVEVFQWTKGGSTLSNPTVTQFASPGVPYSIGAFLTQPTAGQAYTVTLKKTTMAGGTINFIGPTTTVTAQNSNFVFHFGDSNSTDFGNQYVYYDATIVPHDSNMLLYQLKVKIVEDDPSPPTNPSNLQTTAVQWNQVSLLWGASSEDQVVEFYEVSINGAVTVIPGTATAYSLPGVTPSTAYSIMVRARNWFGTPSGWSNTITVNTPIHDTTPPTQPGAISVSPLTSNSATVSWGASTDNSGTVAGYTATLMQGANLWDRKTTTSTSVSYNGLPAATPFNVSVVAFDGVPLTSTASTASFSTSQGSAPGPVVASNIQTNSFRVTWPPFTVSPATAYYLVELNGVATSAGAISGIPNLFAAPSGLSANTTYTVRVQAVGTTGLLSPWSDLLTVTTDVPLAALPAVPSPTGSTAVQVASAGASLSVDNKGSANYSIPLQIALGRGGLQPQLSLSYSSGGGNGVAGVGWALSTGFAQSITRGRSILARDGVVQGVTFSPADKFYLDGKRLLVVSGSNGVAGSTYRTEVDSFVTVTSIGSGTNIDRFEVVDKSGTKSIFGKYNSTTDAFQKGGGETGDLAYTYALKRVEDAIGNYIDFTYENLGGGEYVLKQIDYTGGAGILPAAQVLLSYESRTDQPVTFLANRFFNHRARLAVITAKSGSTITAAYGLNYDNNTGAPAYGRSRLLTVAPFLADPQPPYALQTCPVVTIGWQDFSDRRNATGNLIQTGASGGSILWGDSDGDGKDDAIFDLGYTTTAHPKLADFDGDGKKDKLIVDVSGSGSSISIGIGAQNAAGTYLPIGGNISSYFDDPPSGGAQQHLLLQTEATGAASRVTAADFTGDGRDDILVHGFDGKLHLFVSQGTSFAAPIDDTAHNPFVGGAGNTYWVSSTIGSGHFEINSWVGSHYNVKPMPCDLNGDGRTDYVCVTYMRSLKTNPVTGVATGYTNFRLMTGVLSKPDGSFSPPFSIANIAMAVPITTDDADGSMRIDDLNSGAMPGDFNGDGLTDFMILVPVISSQAGLYTNVFGSHRWVLFLNQGENAYGSVTFAQCNGPIPNQVTLPGTGEIVNSYFQPTRSAAGHLGFLNNAVANYTSLAPEGQSFITGFESAAGTTNNYIWDVNHDGLADLVWYVGMKPDETNVTGAGWYVMYSTGKFSPDGSTLGFSAPVRLNYLPNLSGSFLNGDLNYFVSLAINHDIDYDGDGHPDFFIQTTHNGQPEGYGYVYLATDSNGVSAPFGDLVTSVTDGLGRRTDVAYKGAKDSSVYTPGAAVAYPIRDLRASTPVVANVWHDSGTGVATDRAQFSYQYSGNRLDLSGRGSLGFHSFVTLDRQTNLFKYQFLAQSFPMTGLTHREETYRWWNDGQDRFRYISSHDNTIVFDKVMSGATAWGTVWPYISKAIEYRWEDSTSAHFSFTTAASNSHPEDLFPQTKPVGEHIKISAESRFDGATSTQTTLPPALNTAGYYPSDLNGSANKVVGIQPGGTADPKVAGSLFSNLPGNITYGNLTKLTTDYGDDFTETVDTAYLGVTANGLSGLVENVTTTVVSPIGGTEIAPIKRYTYWSNGATRTPLVETETIDSPDNKLDLTTTYARQPGTGLVTATTITGYNSAGPEGATVVGSLTEANIQHIGTFQASANTAFDPKFDLPTTSSNAAPYSHQTVTQYHAFLGKPVSVKGPNYVAGTVPEEVTTVYDALGRAIQQTDVLKNLTTNTTFAWDTSQTVTVPSGIVGLPGVTLTSAYSVTTTATVAPSTTAYYDRLGRVIRTIKNGFNGQLTITDTVYNKLGQVVASSLPYASGGTPLWTFTTYDALGRVVTVTAPNGTVTTNAYKGRITQVSVDAPNLGGVNPAAQINSTQVDAKGRTVKVWNNDNQPTLALLAGSDAAYTSSTPASIAFALDGFGRMRTTTLLGQTQTITATYDGFGRQTSLNDPDKGNWTYVNNALGQVVKQTDANTNVTRSTFDRLGRPLSRQTLGVDSSTELATFHYYDTDATKPNTVAKGTKGWIGAPEREEADTTGAPGFNAPKTVNLHYYNEKGLPTLELAQTDGKWFYTYSDYDAYSRIRQVRHYWKPSLAEEPGNKPYLWQDFGYTYTYDGSGINSKSYLIALTDSLGRSWWDTPTYDYMDRVTEVKKGSSLVTKRAYRAEDGVLTSIKTGLTSGATQIQNLGFTFDGLGNLKQRTDTSVTGGTENFVYDNLNRLTTAGNNGTVDYFANGNIQTKKDVSNTSSGTCTYDALAVNALVNPTVTRNLPHAVGTAFGYTFVYDLNGNLRTRSKSGDVSTVEWAGFDKPRWMAKTTATLTAAPLTAVGSEFHYNAARSRVMQLEFNEATNSGPTKYNRKRIYALGSTLELNYTTATPALNPTWDLKKVRIYVPGPDGIIGAREFDVTSGVTGTEKALVYHYDHLGSITATTLHTTGAVANDNDTSNPKPAKYSEDAWGQRRNPFTWSGAPLTTGTNKSDDGSFDSATPRGYTGHEMLDDLGLVHMNGRIYDPLLGRFLSADTKVPAPGDMQSYNRYSYVRNRPLSLVDLSGFDDGPPPYMYTMRTAQLVEAYGPEKGLKIANDANLAEAKGTLIGGMIVYGPTVIRIVIEELFRKDEKPAERSLEHNKPKEKSSDGNMDSKENPSKDPEKKSSSPGRRGNQQTQDHLDTVRDDFQDKNPDQKHVAGGRDKTTGQPLPEEHIPGPDPKNPNKGGSYPDLTFEDKDGNRTRINTVDTNKDGTETARERRNADRILEQTGEPVITIPKPTPPPPDDDKEKLHR